MVASIGDGEVINEALLQSPADSPAVLITQHMHSGFTRSLAQRLDRLCRITVGGAIDRERALSGHASIAPGDQQRRFARSGAHFVIVLVTVNR